MKKIPTWICVVALALHRDDGRWLMHQRPLGKAHAGQWEFPGGKVEPEENAILAVLRESKEELGLTLNASSLVPAGFAESVGDGENPPIVILLYRAQWDGAPVSSLEGGEVAWFSPLEILRLDMPPLDMVLARQLFEKASY